jgi:hypothetical protein
MVNIFITIDKPTINITKLDAHESCISYEIKTAANDVLILHFDTIASATNFSNIMKEAGNSLEASHEHGTGNNT